MAVLNPDAYDRPGAPAPSGPAPARRRVLLVSRDEEVDSLLARRRVAAHLTELDPSWTGEADGEGSTPPDAALVCDDEPAARRLLARGVPVVHLCSGTPSRAAAPPDGAVYRVHRPRWLPGPWPALPKGARPTGVLAPARLTRDRTRRGSLLLLSVWGVPAQEADGFASGLLRRLAVEALRRTGGCDVVCDTRPATIRDALGGLDGVRVHRAADADVDALHAGAEVFLASPVLGAITLAQARRAPLVLLPPLGRVQRDLAERVSRSVPLPVATDPPAPALWEPRDAGAADPWAALDTASDDLRGAQRVARTLRQLALAPL
ncbi:CGA synthase-related protein [Streptomyces formicae]|uniref:CGA synthase-related protein n=1 Tax=Streptomyces formicae TaxID=1616117 RepID=A0ABY3WJY0_9ACTN|nr:CGA synthase-related protein [Streptomyces formicae]UNM11784.1 CGA synthase-related protein [Streptomyces formicae]